MNYYAAIMEIIDCFEQLKNTDITTEEANVFQNKICSILSYYGILK